MGNARSVVQPPSATQTSTGSWGVGGSVLCSQVYGTRPRGVRYEDREKAHFESLLNEAFRQQQPIGDVLRAALLRGSAINQADSMDLLSKASRDEVCIFLGANMDAIVERELFLADCVPFLKNLFLHFGIALVLCESRWDKDLELLNAHDTSRVRQSELQRSLRCSCGTASVLFLGDKLGSAPLPSNVDCAKFDMVLTELDEMGRSSELLRRWYVKDERPTPAVYRLRPIQSIQSDFLNLQGRKQQEEAVSRWENEALNPMLADLRAAAESLRNKNSVSAETAKKMLSSDLAAITNLAVKGDLTENGKSARRTIAVIRNFEAVRGRLQDTASKYVDVEHECRDAQAAIELERLKNTVRNQLPEDQVFDFSIPWEKVGLNPQSTKHSRYLAAYGDKVTWASIKILSEQLRERPSLSDLEAEVFHHLRLLQIRAASFAGREEERVKIDKFLSEHPTVPSAPHIPAHTLVISGPEGVGKTSLLAATVLARMQAESTVEHEVSDASLPTAQSAVPPETIWLIRFCGSTHDSRTGKGLMTSLCSQLSAALGVQNPATVQSWNLPYALIKLLSNASAQHRIVVVLDGIDKLEGEGKKPLHWLPFDSLPSYVTFILTSTHRADEVGRGQDATGPEKRVRLETAAASLTREKSVHGALLSRLPDAASWVMLRSFRPEEATSVLHTWLERDARRMPESDMAAVLGSASAAVDSGSGLMLLLLYWLSADPRGLRSSSGASLYGVSTESVLVEVLQRLERRFGVAIVTLLVGGLAAAREGLTRGEMEDLCAINDAVLQHSFRWAVAPLARVNPHHVSLLLQSLALLTEERRGGVGQSVIALRHGAVRRACVQRYLSDKVASPGQRFEPIRTREDLVVLFSGAASGKYHPLVLRSGAQGTDSWGEVVLNSDRQLPPNPDILRRDAAGTAVLYNERKMSEYPYQLAQLGRWEALLEALSGRDAFEFLSEGTRVETLADLCKQVVKELGAAKLNAGFQKMLKPENLPNARARGAMARKVGRLLWAELGLQEEAVEALGAAREAHQQLPEGAAREREEAETQWVLGELAQLQSDWEGATQYMDMAWKLRRTALGRAHPKTVQAGWFASAAEGRQKRPDAALLRLREVLRDQRWDLEVHEEDVAETMARLADMELQAGRIEEAQELHANTVRLRKVVFGVDHLEVGNSVVGLGMTYDQSMQTMEALARFGEALIIKRARLGWKNVEVAGLLNNIGVAHERLGQLDKAVLRYEQALGIFRERLGEDEALVATIANNLGNVYKSVGSTKLAMGAYGDARRIRTLREDSNPLALAETLNNLAGVLMMEGQLGEAEECCEKSLRLRTASLPEDAVEVAAAKHNLARVLIAKGVHDQRVEALCVSALQVKTAQLGSDNLEVAEVLMAVSDLAQAQGRTPDALGHAKQVLVILKSQLGPSHPLVAQQHMVIASLHLANSDLNAALLHAKDALAARLNPKKSSSRRDMRPDGGWWLWGSGESGDLAVAASLELVSDLYTRGGKLQRAFDSAHRALVFRRKLAAEPSSPRGNGESAQSTRWRTSGKPSTPAAPKKQAEPNKEERRMLAAALMRVGKLARRIERGQEGLGWLQEALEIRREVDGEAATSVGETLHEIGMQLWSLDRGGRAVETLEQALAVRREAEGPESVGVAETLNALAAGMWNQGRGAEAIEMGRESVRVREKVLGEHHVKLAEALSNMADLLRSQGALKEALEHAQRALLILQQAAKGGGDDIWQGAQTPRDAQTAGGESDLQLEALDEESPRREAGADEAEQPDEGGGHASTIAAQPPRAGRRPGDSEEVSEALAQVAMLWRELGEEDNARELLEQRCEILVRLHGPEHPAIERAVALIRG